MTTTTSDWTLLADKEPPIGAKCQFRPSVAGMSDDEAVWDEGVWTVQANPFVKGFANNQGLVVCSPAKIYWRQIAPPPFKAAVTPTLAPEAQYLVDIYNNTYGSSAPGCNPAGLANVLEAIVQQVRDDISQGAPQDLYMIMGSCAAQLRGKSND